MYRWSSRVPTLATALIAVVACGVSGCTSAESTRHAAKPDPPAAATRFCSSGGAREISTSLGLTPEHVTPPRRTGHAYACRFVYPNGAIRVSFRRFPTAPAAAREVQAIAVRRGRRPEPPAFGEELHAMVTTDGSTIVRKARDVLDVDVGGLPAQFGSPPQAASVISLAVAVTIIGHWSPG